MNFKKCPRYNKWSLKAVLIPWEQGTGVNLVTKMVPPKECDGCMDSVVGKECVDFHRQDSVWSKNEMEKKDKEASGQVKPKKFEDYWK